MKFLLPAFFVRVGHHSLRESAGLFFCVLLAALSFTASPARALDDLAPATTGAEQEKKRSFSTGTSLFDDADITGGLYYFQRDRRRYDVDEHRYMNNINHATVQANADLVSGFLGEFIGFDFGVFGSHDIKSTGSPDHEMNFFPWHNPWNPDWSKRRTRDGMSIYKALVKAKAGPIWARAGYFQPTGPTTLGVNWSIMPGTYRGVNAGADFGGLSLAVVWADAYKSPWFKELNSFHKNDGKANVAHLWSGGMRYSFAQGPFVEAAYGESKGHLWNAHFKTGHTLSFGQEKARDKLSFGYSLYLMGDNDNNADSPNDNFAGTASHHVLFAHYNTGLWTAKLEATYTRAPFDSPWQVGYFAYRLTDVSGSSQGAYDTWWNARSDWNHHNEKAAFVSLERKLDDFLPIKGFYAGVGAAIGWDGEAYKTAEHFKEWAFTFEAGYVKPDGPLKDAFVKLHYTEYRNGTSKPSWYPYKNGFQSEHDFMLFMGIPFDI
ncbi:OprD family outer membrane porin [Desulfovibrio sp. OttesenSCG-928-G15]|nr:OprD family outer membrane porin [Desulfovibrio sp. OttesenSCG-928-G15]